MGLNAEQAEKIARELGQFIGDEDTLKDRYFVKVSIANNPADSSKVLLYKKEVTTRNDTTQSLADTELPENLMRAIKDQFPQAQDGIPDQGDMEVHVASPVLFNAAASGGRIR